MTGTTLLLAAGTRLLHIGPSKTGTTAIQGALKQARTTMADNGVVYPGTDRQHWRAARAVLGTPGPKGDPPVDPKCWDRLVRQVRGAGNRRVVVSAEAFSAADEDGARKVVPALGGSSVHVIVTLRPLAKMLPSIWQQSVRQGLRSSYDEWLRRMLERASDAEAPRFWQRHRQDLLVERWARVAGPENLTAVVLDESDRMMLMRTFEQLLGLPAGLLQPESRTNPSLSFGEVEFVRLLNRELHTRGWSYEQHRTWVRKGLVQYLQGRERPAVPNQQIRTPVWAAERIAELGAAAAERIPASGVRVVGDVSTLAARPVAPAPSDPEPQALVHAQTAADAVVGAILVAQRRQSRDSRVRVRVPERTVTRRVVGVVRALPTRRSTGRTAVRAQD